MANRKRDCRLPEVVIQHILSFLSPEKAAQCSVLSKTWLRAWSTYPDIVFRQDSICRKLAAGESNSEQGKEKFAKFVYDNLLRYSKHNLPINKFLLDILFFDSKLASQLDKWLVMVVNMGVKHLVLHIDPPKTASYCLPPIIFASNQLTSLKVLGSRTFLPNKFISLTLKNPVLGNSIIKCCNLKSLFLLSIYLDDWIFQTLCSSCPLIEYLSLEECWGMKNIQVSNLCKLVYLDLTNTRNQRECNALERVHLSSQTLRRLTFCQCVALIEAKIDTPNLLLLQFVSNRIPSFSTKFSLSEQFNSKIYIRPRYDLDTSFFVKFKDLLTKLNGCEYYLDIDIYSKNIWFDIEDLREIPLPQPQIRILKISTSSPSLTYLTLVHGLLWSCHPETLEVRFPSKMDYEFIKVLCKELIGRTSPNCCSSDQVMCWRHYLNHVEVEYLEWADDWKLMRQPFDWKSLVDGSMIPKYYSVVRFNLNWIL